MATPKRETQTDHPATAGAKVIVASKLPMALELQHSQIREVQRRLRETVWTDKEAAKVGPIVRVNGTSYPRGQAPEGFRAPPQIVAGYALTYGVDKDWWDKWAAQNKDAPFVASGLLFAAPTRDAVLKIARGHADLESGLDPVVPPPKDGSPGKVDPRLPRPIKGITFEGAPGPTDLDAA